MRLMERDMRILSLVREMGFITSEQVRHEFANVRESEMYRRLGELEKAKLIRSERVLTQNRKLYLATRENFSVGRNDIFGDELPFVSRPRVHQVDHDLKVTNVRIALERYYPHCWWTPESVLKRRAPKPMPFMDEVVPIGDGICESPAGTTFAIEVECSVKSEKRVRSTMAAWMRQGDVDYALYVADGEAVFKRLYRTLEDLSELDSSSRILIARYPELIAGKTHCFVISTNGQRLLGKNETESKEIEADGNAN